MIEYTKEIDEAHENFLQEREKSKKETTITLSVIFGGGGFFGLCIFWWNCGKGKEKMSSLKNRCFGLKHIG